MKFQLFLLVAYYCLCGCSKQIYLVECAKQDNTEHMASKMIENVMHIGSYRPDMQTHDTFFHFLSLGMPLSLSDVDFSNIPTTELFSSNKNIDKLYLFAKMADRVFICDSTVKDIGISFSDLVIVNKDIHEFTSATYNDGFLLTIPFLKSSDSTKIWNSFSVDFFHLDSIETKKKKLYLKLPRSQITGELLQIIIHRPWLESPILLKSKHEYGKLAIIDGLILAKTFATITKDDNYIVEVNRTHKIIDKTIAKTESNNILIGFICRIL